MPIRLTIISSDGAEARFVEFDQPLIRIGRESDCDLRLPFPAVSGRHCTIFSENGQIYQIRDEGSTNGTRLNGAFLEAQKPAILEVDACVKIAGMRIDIDTNPLVGSAPPIAHTGTLVRMMLSDTMVEAEADHARLEVLGGPAKGKTVFLPDKFESLTISDEPSAILQIPNLSTPLKITPEDDGFAICTIDSNHARLSPRERAKINGVPLEGVHHLASEDLIKVAGNVLKFFDPLEELLLELDAKHTARPDDDPGVTALGLDAARQDTEHEEQEEGLGGAVDDQVSTAPGDEAAPVYPASAAPADAATSNAPWSIFEIVFIASTLVIIVAVGYLFFVIFT